MTPLPNSPQQIERRKREDLKKKKARQVRRSEAQRIRQTPKRSCMSIELKKLAYLGDPMQAISLCRKWGAIPHAFGELCLWRPSVDLMEADSNDEKYLILWCHPDSPLAALHKAKEENTVQQCQFSQCPDRGDHLTTVCPTLCALQSTKSHGSNRNNGS
jgi:hypothetical protein